jgi:hypothetical protein
MDHDDRTADNGMLGSETENPGPGRDSPHTTPEPAATTSEGHPVATPTCPTPTAPASAPTGPATLNRDHAWPEGEICRT